MFEFIGVNALKAQERNNVRVVSFVVVEPEGVHPA